MRFNGVRSWLFLAGADDGGLRNGPSSGADALIQELEDSVPAPHRAAARALTADAVAGWRAAGVVAAVRVNPLADGGLEDLAAVVPARPDVVMLPKCASPGHVEELDREVTRLEQEHGLPPGDIALVPNVECAAGLRLTFDIARASARVVACLVASEDLAAHLGAVRSPEGTELDHARARFLVDCRAAGVQAIDCPCTWSDPDGLRAETEHAVRLGYTAKSAVAAAQVPVLHEVLTPSPDAVARAERIVTTFEEASRTGVRHVELDGRLVELPSYLNARRTLDRARALAVA